jgi:hypothetical protein
MNQPLSGRERIAMRRASIRAERDRRLYRRATVGILVTAVVLPLIAAWALMLMADVTHHDWARQIPALGFDTAWLLSILASAGFAAIMLTWTCLRDWAKS